MACSRFKYDSNNNFDIILTWMGIDPEISIDEKLDIIQRYITDTLNYNNSIADKICSVIRADLVNNYFPGDGSFNGDWTFDSNVVEEVETITNLPNSDVDNTSTSVNTSLKSKLLDKNGLGNLAFTTWSNEFRDEIIKRTIFGNVPTTGTFNDDVNGSSYINNVLFQFKCDLVDKFRSLGISYDLAGTTDTQEITEIIKAVLDDFVNSDIYRTKSTEELRDYIKAAYMLEFFDDLMANQAPYIQKTENFKNNPDSIGKNMYVWIGPSIKYDQSWSNKEIVGIEQYTGSFIKMLCDYFNEYDAYAGRNLPEKITFKGFNNAMATVMEWVNTTDNVPQEIISEVRKGQDCDWSKVIDAYLEFGNNANGILAHKLMGIQRYIFGKKVSDSDTHEVVPEQFRSEFKNQIRNLARCNYMVYRISYDQHGAELKGIPLKEQYYNTQQSNMRKMLTMRAAYFSKYGKNEFQNILDKYGITIKNINNGESFVLTFDSSKYSAKLNTTDTIWSNNLMTDATQFKVTFKHDGKRYSISSMERVTPNYDLQEIRTEQGSFKDLDDSYIKNLVLDLGITDSLQNYSSIVDALNSLTNQDLTLGEIFSEPLVLVLTAASSEPSYISGSSNRNKYTDTYKDGYYNFWSYTQDLKTVAEFSGIAQGVEELNVLKDGNDNNLPGFQLAKQVDDIHSMIEDFNNPVKQNLRNNIHTSGNEVMNTSVFQDTNDLCKRGVIKKMFIRGDMKVLNVVIKAAGLTVPEVSHLAVVKDFYEHFRDNDGNIIHQSGTLADKQSHYCPEIATGNIYISVGKTLKTELNNILIGSKTARASLNNIYTHIRDVRGKKLIKQLDNLFARYARVFPEFKVPDKSFESIFLAFYNLRNILRSKDSEGKFIYNKNKLVELFRNANVDLNDNFDYVTWKDGSLDLNPTLFNNICLYLSPDDSYFKNRIEAAKEADIKSLIKEGDIWSEFRDPSFKTIWSAISTAIDSNKSYYGNSKDWYDSVSRSIKLCRVFKRNADGSRGKEVQITMSNIDELLPGTVAKRNSDYEVVYNPIYEAYTAANSVISPQFNELLLGDPAAYDVKSSVNKSRYFDYVTEMLDSESNVDPSDNALNFYSRVEAEQDNTMSKRAMLLGATRFAIPHSKAKVAVMSDIKAPTFNNSGVEITEVVHDGGGFENPLHAILENLMVGSASVGMNKKTIFGYVDPQTGILRELKWATFSVTNYARRNYDPNSNVNQEEMFKKMNNLKFNKDIDFNEIYNLNEESGAMFREPVYRYDNNTGKYYKLLKFEQDNGWKAIWQEVDVFGKNKSIEPISIDIDSTDLYGIDQAFGGSWIMTLDPITNKLQYEEFLDSKILAAIVNKYALQDSYIGYVVNKSAIKVGAVNVNNSDIFNPSNNLDLNYFEMLQDYGGIQMDADHEIDLAEVTEMTQMISSIIQRGTMYNLVDQMYEDIGKVALEALNSISKANESDDPNDLFKQIGKALFDTFDSGNKDTLGLAQAFLRRAQSALSSKGNEKVIIPLSAETITPAYLNTVAALIRKRGIKRKYAGFPGVQVPSYGIMKTYNFGGFTGLNFQEISNKIRPFVKNGTFNSIEEAFTDLKLVPTFKSLKSTEFLDNQELHDVYNASYSTHGSFDDFVTYLDTIYSGNELYTGDPVIMSDLDGNPVVTIMGTAFTPQDFATWRIFNKAHYRISNPFVKKIDPYNIDFEDTIVIRNKETGEIKTVVVNSVSKYDEIRNLQDHNLYEYYNWEIQPRELRQGYNTFDIYWTTVDENGLQHINSSTRSIYDLDASRAALYLADIQKNGTSTSDYELKYNLINSVCIDETFPQEWRDSSGNVILNNDTIPELIKFAVAKMRRRCKEIDSSNSGQISVSHKSFGEGDFQIRNLKYKANQIMIGMADAKAFGLEKGDSIYKVQTEKEKFFRDKLLKKIPTISNVFRALNNRDIKLNVDAVVTLSDGRTLLVSKNDGNLNDKQVVDSRNYDIDSAGKIWYKGEEFCPAGHKTFKTITGLDYDIMFVDDLSEITDLNEESQISLIQFNYNSNNKEDVITVARLMDEDVDNRFLDITKEGKINPIEKENLIQNLLREQDLTQIKKIDDLAKKQYKSFLLHLQYIGARIPTQAMQSFADVEVVGFTNSPTNECYMARSITWIAGSDYDIDKFYCMGYEVLPNGMIATQSNLDKYFDPNWVLSLPMPDGQNFNVIAGNSQNGTIEYYGNPDQNDIVWYNPDETLEENIKRILESGKHTVAYYVPEKTFSDAALAAYILGKDNYNEVATEETMNRIKKMKQLYKYLNIHSQTKLGTRRREIALKNRSVKALHNICGDIKVQVDAQLPVNMDEGKTAAKKNAASSEEIYFNQDQAIMKFKLQYQNMVGKNVIGSVAVSLKAYFAALKSFNEQVINISNNLKVAVVNNSEQDFYNVLKELNEITFESRNGDLVTFGNINFDPLLKVINDLKIEKIAISPSLFFGLNTGFMNFYSNGEFNLKELAKTLDRLANGEYFIKQGNKYVYKSVDVAMDLSCLLSLATDNAKELVLAKLNATSEFVDLYSSALIEGESFSHIADTMTSNTFNIVARFTKSNIFVPNSRNYSLRSAIDFVLDLADLSTAPKGFMEYFVREYKEQLFGKTGLVANELRSEPLPYDQILYILRNGNISEQNALVADMVAEFKKMLLENQLIDNIPIRDWVLDTVRNEYNTADVAESNMSNGDSDEEGNEDEGPDEQESNEDDDPDAYSADLRAQLNAEQTWIDRNDIKAKDWRSFYIYLTESLYVKNELLDKLKREHPNEFKEYKNVLTTLGKLIDKAEELKIEGKLGSINQGTKNNFADEYAWVSRINTFVNRKYRNNKNITTVIIDGKPVKKQQDWVPFDLIKFVDIKNTEYRELQIAQYEKVKSSINILKSMTQTEHFNAMLTFVKLNRNLIERAAVNQMAHIMARDALMTKKDKQKESTINGIPSIELKSLSAKSMKVVRNFARDTLIMNWFFRWALENKFSFTIPKGQMYFNANSKNVLLEKPETINFDASQRNERQIANFLQLMDFYIIPKLKQYANSVDFSQRGEPNAFLSSLILDGKRNPTTKKMEPFTRLVSKTTNLNDEAEIRKYDDMLMGFKKIWKLKVNTVPGLEDVGNFTIGDAFFLYNLFVNKDGFGRNSWTRMFEDMITANYDFSTLNSYYQFLYNLDSKAIPWLVNGNIDKQQIDYDIRNLKIKLALANENEAYRVGAKVKTGMPNGKVEVSGVSLEGTNYNPQIIPGYYPFKLAANSGYNISLNSKSIFGLNNVEIGAPSVPEIINFVMKTLENQGITNIKIQLFPDSVSADLSGVDGYVDSGVIYINPNLSAKSTAGVLVHELSHIIAASMKFSKNPEIRSKYYKLLEDVKANSDNENSVWGKIKSQLLTSSVYAGKTNSDLMEEILVRGLEGYVTGNEYFTDEYVENANSMPDVKMLSEILSNIFGLKHGDKLSNYSAAEIGVTDLGTIFSMFKSILNEKDLTSDFDTAIVNSQRSNRLKEVLKKLAKNGKITLTDC